MEVDSEIASTCLYECLASFMFYLHAVATPCISFPLLVAIPACQLATHPMQILGYISYRCEDFSLFIQFIPVIQLCKYSLGIWGGGGWKGRIHLIYIRRTKCLLHLLTVKHQSSDLFGVMD